MQPAFILAGLQQDPHCTTATASSKASTGNAPTSRTRCVRACVCGRAHASVPVPPHVGLAGQRRRCLLHTLAQGLGAFRPTGGCGASGRHCPCLASSPAPLPSPRPPPTTLPHHPAPRSLDLCVLVHTRHNRHPPACLHRAFHACCSFPPSCWQVHLVVDTTLDNNKLTVQVGARSGWGGVGGGAGKAPAGRVRTHVHACNRVHFCACISAPACPCVPCRGAHPRTHVLADVSAHAHVHAQPSPPALPHA